MTASEEVASDVDGIDLINAEVLPRTSDETGNAGTELKGRTKAQDETEPV